MAGGPGGTGGGVQSESLAWAIIMSAFAGASPQSLAVSLLEGKLTWAVFQRSVVSYSGLSIHASCSTRSQCLNHI